MMLYKNYLPINMGKVRKRWKLSQLGFAGYTRGMIQHYESGQIDPPLDLLLYLMEETGISADNFLTRELLITEIPDRPITGRTEYTAEERKERMNARRKL